VILPKNANLEAGLNEIIDREVYKEVRIEERFPFDPSKIQPEVIEKIKTNEGFVEEYKKGLSKQFQAQGYENLEIVELDFSSNCLLARYTAYYAGSRQYPEIHLKTLLILNEGSGENIYDPVVFDEIVEKTKKDLGESNRKEKEGRIDYFASLFKSFIYRGGGCRN